MNSQFQQTLKQLTFKTFYHNQMTTFDYDNLFANRRVLVFSITQFRTVSSQQHIENYIQYYHDIIAHNIDDVCAIDSNDGLSIPMIDKKTKLIKGLSDQHMIFVESLANHYDYKKSVQDLSRMWQYVVVINNGEPEKLWHNPFKEDAPWSILKDERYRYRKLSANEILKYLIDNKQ